MDATIIQLRNSNLFVQKSKNSLWLFYGGFDSLDSLARFSAPFFLSLSRHFHLSTTKVNPKMTQARHATNMKTLSLSVEHFTFSMRLIIEPFEILCLRRARHIAPAIDIITTASWLIQSMHNTKLNIFKFIVFLQSVLLTVNYNFECKFPNTEHCESNVKSVKIDLHTNQMWKNQMSKMEPLLFLYESKRKTCKCHAIPFDGRNDYSQSLRPQ